MSAVFSEGGESEAIYRWRLDRDVQPEGIVVALVGVNPSTAGAEVNDATIRKDIGFGLRLGWKKIIKVNKLAYRATDVREVAKVDDPIGVACDQYLVEAFAQCDLIIPCWGPLAKLPKKLRTRWRAVYRLMCEAERPIKCFGVAKDGQPRHTLMLPYSTPLVDWEAPCGIS